jgi:DNA-binding PadR family transcriptional regulator
MAAEDLLPLKPDVFHILMLLLDGPRHGYVIMQDIEESSGGEVRLLPGALYRHLERMLDDGMIEERMPDGSSDARRRVYRVTPFGREVARAEALRLERVLERARQRQLVRDPGT